MYQEKREVFKITETIQKMLNINFILDAEKKVKVHKIQHCNHGIVNYNKDFNIIRDKEMLLNQFNMQEIIGIKDENLVVQLISD